MSDNNTNKKGPATPTPSNELTKYNDSLPSDSLAENTLLQSQYIRFLENPDDYSDLSFSSTEAKFIRRKLTHLTTGAFAAIPLICRNSLCPWAERCPFWQLDRAPEGRACLVETTLLKEWTIGFLKEYGVHPESMTDRIYVQELAEIELLLYRINSNLAKLQYGELVAESVNDVTPQGNVIYEEKVVPLMDLKLRLQGRRDRVVKLMVGDRQEKYKRQAALKQSDKEDASTQGSSLKQKLDQLQRQVAIVGAKITDSPDGILAEASNDKARQEKQQEPREKLDNQLEEVADIEENSTRPSAETPQNNKENELSEEIVDEPYASSNVIDIFLDDEDNGDNEGSNNKGSSGE